MPLFRRQRDPAARLDAFFARFAGKHLIVHGGFADNWLEELLAQAGGAGYFRLDLRQMDRRRPAPVEWVVQTFLEPLDLPLPLFVEVREADLLVRHLTRGGQAVHPSEILWFLDELETRHHARLTRHAPDTLETTRGIPVEDNEPEAMLGGLQ
ncbi:MAG TPA: hypothetical protein ENN42_04970 [Thioalkalivibrio sp.]|nr:hypothetical protein [Thioalkalivibrio sp.]